MSSLAYLDLSDNQLRGSIPSGFNELKSLTSVTLAQNNLVGSIPESILFREGIPWKWIGTNLNGKYIQLI
jgi:hypothetical protein